MSEWMSVFSPFTALNDPNNSEQSSTNIVTDCSETDNKYSGREDTDKSNDDCKISSNLSNDGEERGESMSNICDHKHEISQDICYSIYKDRLDFDNSKSACAHNMDSDSMSACKCLGTDKISDTNKMKRSEGSDSNVQSNTKAHKNSNLSVVGANSFKVDYKKLHGTKELIIKLQAIPPGMSSVKPSQNDVEYGFYPDSQEKYSSNRQKSTRHTASVRNYTYDSSTESDYDAYVSSNERSKQRMERYAMNDQVHGNRAERTAGSMFFDDESDHSTEDESMKDRIQNVISSINDQDDIVSSTKSLTSPSVVSSSTPVSMTPSLLSVHSNKKLDFNSEFLKRINSEMEIEHEAINNTNSPESVNYCSIITKRPYRCMTCGARFAYMSTLDIHKSSHDGEGSQQCPECGKVFFLAISLRIHLSFHTGGAVDHKCESCGESFSSFNKLSHHKRVNHRKAFKCSICKSEFKVKRQFQNHMYTHTGEKPYSCTLCPQRFRSQSNLIAHRKFHSTWRPFGCNICNAGFTNHSTLHRHMEKHLTESLRIRELKDILNNQANNNTESSMTNDSGQPGTGNNNACAQAGEAAASSMSTNVLLNEKVKQNLMEFSENEVREIDQLRCPVCAIIIHSHHTPANLRDTSNRTQSRSTWSRSDLSDRSNEHRPYKCDICQKCFRQYKGLCSHRIIHSDVKPFLCPICNIGFRQKANMQRHVINHGIVSSDGKELTLQVNQPVIPKGKMHSRKAYSIVDEKESIPNKIIEVSNILSSKNVLNIMKCSYCKKSFLHKIHFDAHMRIHTGDRPYCCEICDKGFKQKGNLLKHQMIHTGEKPFVCPVCNKTFTQKQNMQKHHELWHSDVSHKDITKYNTARNTKRSGNPFGTIKCECCNKTFMQKVHLDTHMRTHTGERPYCCKLCSLCFTQKGNLVRHQSVHTGEKLFACPVCGESFTRKRSMDRHKKHRHRHIRHNIPPQRKRRCILCYMIFPSIDDLSFHMESHKQENRFPCEYCIKSFQHARQLVKHMRKHRRRYYTTSKVPDEEIEPAVKSEPEIHKDYMNKESENTIKSENDEENSREDEEVHDSNSSEDMSGHKEQYRHHVNRRSMVNSKKTNICHTMLPWRKRKCILCYTIFPTIDDLSLHMQSHKQENRFPCKYCIKSFQHARQLVTHMKKHRIRLNCTTSKVTDEEIEPTVISEPEIHKDYMNKETENDEENSREDEEVHDSDSSEDMSGHKEQYRHHVNRRSMVNSKKTNICHTMLPPRKRKCILCYTIFPSIGDLSLHMESHKQENRFPCKYCIKSFQHARQLVTHMKKHRIRLNCTTSKVTDEEIEPTVISEPEIHKDYMNKETENDEEKSREDELHDSDSSEHRSGHKGVDERSIDVEKQKEDYIVALSNVTHASSDSISESRSSFAKEKRSIPLNQCANENNDKDFKCKECNKAFECDTDLMDHMAVHICQLTQTCLLCDKCFVLKISLNKHMLTHLSKRSYACQYCPKSYKEESKFTNHMKLHIRQEIWKKYIAPRFTDIQETRVPASDEPQMTSIVQGNLSVYETESLSVLSSEVEPLALHDGEIRPGDISESGVYFEKRKLRSSFKCQECKKVFEQKNDLMAHKVVHTLELTIKCLVCDRDVERNEYLRKHVFSHKPKRFHCNSKYCPKSFKTPKGLRSHMRLHQEHMGKNRAKKVSASQNTHISKSKLKKMMHSVQENVSTPEIVLSPELEILRLQDGDIEPAENNASHLPYICTLCNKCFKSKEYLEIHVQNHIAEESYKHRCGLTTDNKSWQRAINLIQKLKSRVSNFQNTHIPKRTGNQKTCKVRENLIANESESSPGITLAVESLPLQDEEMKPAVLSDLEIYNKDYFSQEIANEDSNIRDNIEVVQDSVISLDISVNKDISGGHSMDDEENSVNQGEASLNISQSGADIWNSRNLTADETEPFPVLCFKVKPLMAQDLETEPGVIIDPEIYMDYMNMTENDSVNSREDGEGAKNNDSSEDLSDNDGASEHNMNIEENVKTTVLNIGVSDISESGIGYAKKKLSSLHMNKRKQKSSLFKCQECNQCFKQKAGLMSHMILHRLKIPLRCSICDRYFARRDLLYKHLYYTHLLGNIPEKMYCNYCNKPYSKQSMLTKHMESCQVQNNIRNHSSTDMSEFHDTHVSLAKVNQNPMIQENLIDNELEQFSVLSCKVEPLTVQNEETEPAIYSDIADDAYYMNPEMRSAPDVDVQNSKSNEAPLTCMECGIHFNCVDALISHSQQHNGSVLDCTICGAKFHLVHELQAHLTKHMSDNPYIAFNLQAMYVTK